MLIRYNGPSATIHKGVECPPGFLIVPVAVQRDAPPHAGRQLPHTDLIHSGFQTGQQDGDAARLGAPPIEYDMQENTVQ